MEQAFPLSLEYIAFSIQYSQFHQTKFNPNFPELDKDNILGEGNESKHFLDGCHHVYLDMGTNTGVQIRKLYEPHLFPNASVLPIFDKFFGPIGERLSLL